MKFLILLSLVVLGTSAPHDVEKRSPDDDDFYIYVPPRGGGRPGIARTRYVAPSLGRFSFPRGYFLEVDFDDRRKREATNPESRQKRSADFDFDDDDFFFYHPVVAKGVTTYSTAPRTTVAQGYVPARPFFYYDDDLFDKRRKKRSADFDLDDDDYYYYHLAAPRVTQQVAAATTYAVASPPVVTNPIYYYDFDDKK